MMQLTDKQKLEKEAILSGNYQHYPLLPMKRWKNGDMDCGIMIAPRWNMIVVINMFMLSPENIKNATVLLYTDLDEVLLDGWIGD